MNDRFIESLKRKNDKIILYGAGAIGEKCYLRLYSKCNIEFVVDKDKRKKIYKVPTYSLEEIIDVKNYFIIVSTNRQNWNEIKQKLIDKNLVEGIDFIWEKYIWRKNAIVYGNCHMEGTAKFMSDYNDFMRKYSMSVYNINHLDSEKRKELEENLLYCDLLITQDIREQNRLNVPSADYLAYRARDALTIRVPNLYGMNFYFPQVDYKDWKIPIREIMNFMGKDMYFTIGFFDKNIENFYQQGKSTQYVVNAIENKEIYSKESIITNFNARIEKLKIRESRCDISISDFIEKNYQDIKLFYNPNHPTNVIFAEKAKRILRIIGIEMKISNRNTCMWRETNNELDSRELFIYGCVKECLGLRFDQEFIRKRKGLGIREFPISLGEYVQDYYAMLKIMYDNGTYMEYLNLKRENKNNDEF